MNLRIVILGVILGTFSLTLQGKNEKKICSKKLKARCGTIVPKNKTTVFNNSDSIPKTLFVDGNYSVIKSQNGSTAKLPCEVTNDTLRLNVSWYKVGEEEPLTENVITKHMDKRYLSKKTKNKNFWNLFIRYTKTSDEGLYRCSISGDEHASLILNLTLITAYANIKISPSVPTIGQPLRLSCSLNNSIEAPLYIFWYKNDRVINYDLSGGATIRKVRKGSEIIFFKAAKNLTGNYSCIPSNAVPATVEVKLKEDD